MLRYFVIALIFGSCYQAVLAWEYDKTWSNGKSIIYKTVGNKGQDIFSSSICKSNRYTIYPDVNNNYVRSDFILKVSNDYSVVMVSSTNKCFPSGTYNRIN